MLQFNHGILLPPQEDGKGQFYQALGDLKFSPAPGGLSLMEGLKSFTLFLGGGGVGGVGGNKVFFTGGMGGVPPPLAKNLLIITHQEKSPQWTNPKFLFPTPKVHSPTK